MLFPNLDRSAIVEGHRKAFDRSTDKSTQLIAPNPLSTYSIHTNNK